MRVSAAKPSQQQIQGLVTLYNSGQLSRAEARARKLIKAYPGILALYDILSAAQAGQGKLEDAAQSCGRALEVDPEHLGANCNLGVIFRKLGRLDEAVSSCRKVLSIDPGHAEAKINLGVALRTMGRFEEAEICYREALRVKPDSVEAHSNLGNVLKDLGRFEEALGSHQMAVRLKPASAEVHNNFGDTLHQLGRFEEAVNCYRHSLKLRPDSADVHTNLGNALGELDRFDEAIGCYECALEINPDLVSALNSLGALYQRKNNIEKANEYSEKALDITPDEPGVILLRSMLLRRMKQVGKATNMLEPLADMGLPDAIRIKIHNELGKQHDLAKHSSKAFEHFSMANDLQAGNEQSSEFNRQDFLDQIRRMDDTLKASWIASWASQADETDYETPAFLVGFPRSGTTLLDQILDAHPSVQVMEEKPAFDDVVLQISKKLGDYPASIAKLGNADIAELRALYFRNAESLLDREPGTLLIDKLPLHIRHISLIVRLFPKTKIILALRHPCDVVLSNFMQHYKINEAMANFFTLEDAAHCYAKIMGLWLKSTRLLPVNYHQFKYESLITDFEGEVGKLLDFLGIGWNDTVRDYSQHARSRGVIKTPSYQAVAEPIYSRARYRWKRYQRQLAPVMDDLAPFIETFGYAGSSLDDADSGGVDHE